MSTGGASQRAEEDVLKKRLEDRASKLQQSINDSNVIGNEYNRNEAEAKIEIDFLLNDHLIHSKWNCNADNEIHNKRLSNAINWRK